MVTIVTLEDSLLWFLNRGNLITKNMATLRTLIPNVRASLLSPPSLTPLDLSLSRVAAVAEQDLTKCPSATVMCFLSGLNIFAFHFECNPAHACHF